MPLVIGLMLALAALLGCDNAASERTPSDRSRVDDASTADAHVAPRSSDAGGPDGAGPSLDAGPAPEAEPRDTRNHLLRTLNLNINQWRMEAASAATQADPEIVVLPEPGNRDYVSGTAHFNSDAVSEVQFDVPDDALSFLVVATPSDISRMVSLRSLEGPSGLRFPADSDADDSERYVPTEVTPTPFMPYAFMVPNRPELAFEPGTYTARFALTYGATPATDVDLDVHVFFKRGSTPPDSGTIDLLFLVVTNSVYDAEGARTDATFQDMLGHLDLLLGTANLALGTVTFVDVDAMEYGIDGPDVGLPAISDIVADHDADAPGAMRMILLDEYTDPGAATNTPASPGGIDSVRAGAAMLNLRKAGLDPDGVTVAHELGHLLGLAHTTDRDWVTHDQLLDTPECTVEQASSVDDAGVPVVYAADCAGHGLENVMFWFGSEPVPFEEYSFSADQSWVMLRNPFVR